MATQPPEEPVTLEENPMGTPGNVGQFAFTQGTPGMPLPAIAGPATTSAPNPRDTPGQCEETTWLVPATPLPAAI